MKDKEVKLEEIEASHTLGGPLKRDIVYLISHFFFSAFSVFFLGKH